jgi:CBS domain-containing protein
MKVSDVMTRLTHIATPDQSLQEVATTMSEQDIGALPVAENDRLIGMITDRDITIRAVAEGKGPATPVREIMTEQLRTCFQDDDLTEVAQVMAERQMRRLPVLDRDSHLVGIISIGDLALSRQPGQAQEALRGVSRSD